MRKYLMIAVFGLLAQSARADVYSVGQSCQTCQSGKCGGVVQTVASNAVGYVSNVGNAVAQPFRQSGRPVRQFLANVKAKLTGKCR